MSAGENKQTRSYGEAILDGFEYILTNDSQSFVIGQGLWSPWYVGNSMSNLDKKFGQERIIDTPVSEGATTGLAVGAAICGKTPIVVHPRMDFALYAMDQIINQAAKWRSMFGGGDNSVNITIRMIINRGGEQGAQHSQALHSIFSHIPGLIVVMPSTPQDARDMLVASALTEDPVIYIDDRWLYEDKQELESIEPRKLNQFGPEVVICGEDITIVSSGYCVKLAKKAAEALKQKNITAEVIDLKVISPLIDNCIIKSVRKTGKILIVDGGWAPCGLSSEIIALVSEKVGASNSLTCGRVTLPFYPAPTSEELEKFYYFDETTIERKVLELTGAKL